MEPYFLVILGTFYMIPDLLYYLGLWVWCSSAVSSKPQVYRIDGLSSILVGAMNAVFDCKVGGAPAIKLHCKDL